MKESLKLSMGNEWGGFVCVGGCGVVGLALRLLPHTVSAGGATGIATRERYCALSRVRPLSGPADVQPRVRRIQGATGSDDTERCGGLLAAGGSGGRAWVVRFAGHFPYLHSHSPLRTSARLTRRVPTHPS